MASTPEIVPTEVSEWRELRARKDDAWARVSSMCGAAVWAGLAMLARLGAARIGAIELMFLFAPLVIVPLGLEVGRKILGREFQLVQRVQPVGAAFAVAAMLLAPGRRAGALAVGWLAVCLIGAIEGVPNLFRTRRERRVGQPGVLARAALVIANVDLVVGGVWFVASRLGMRPMSIQEPIGLLTAVHFHFAGFATATIAATTVDYARDRFQILRWVVPLVVGMPFVVAAGFVVSPALKMGAGIAFSISVMMLAIFMRACSLGMENVVARRMLQVAAAAVFAGMVLSGTYAVADFLGSEVLPIPQMARTHGVLNGVGFGMFGLLGWLVERDGVRG